MVRKMKAILHGSARKLDMGSVSSEMMGYKQICMCLHEFMYVACELGPLQTSFTGGCELPSACWESLTITALTLNLEAFKEGINLS